MNNLPINSASRNHNRLPNPDPSTMDYAARRIASRYSVSLAHARVVAELVSTSIEARL